MHTTLEEWIGREALVCPDGAGEVFDRAVDKVVGGLGELVELLGFGEALHGGEAILQLRNRLFQRLATVHGFSAIAMESSFPQGRWVNDYIAGYGPSAYEQVQEAGFSHGFGKLKANRELVEWMRSYNSDPAHKVRLRFYGFDIPAVPTGIASPRPVLRFALDYLCSIREEAGRAHRERIESCIGEDALWENMAVYMDPTKSIALTDAANALRAATEDLIAEFEISRPDLVARSNPELYAEAMQHLVAARRLLNFHAAMARMKEGANSAVLGIRDASMTDNLMHIVGRERGRGRVLVYAHNGHLQRSRFIWEGMGEWWPAGALLTGMVGDRYAVIGSAVGVSEENGIGAPEAGTLEARLAGAKGTTVLIPTHLGDGGLGEAEEIPVRSGSKKNPTYRPLTAQSLRDFDCLAVVDSTGYARGGPPLRG